MRSLELRVKYLQGARQLEVTEKDPTALIIREQERIIATTISRRRVMEIVEAWMDERLKEQEDEGGTEGG